MKIQEFTNMEGNLRIRSPHVASVSCPTVIPPPKHVRGAVAPHSAGDRPSGSALEALFSIRGIMCWCRRITGNYGYNSLSS